MAYGKGDVSSNSMNQHKAMAGAGMKGSMGVSAYPGRVADHPDRGMSHEMMPDSSRALGMPGKGMPRQAMPDHAMDKGVKDHFMRGGKA